MRESTRKSCLLRSYQQYTVRCGACLSLGPRIGLVTALNDCRGFRLTGSLPLVQQGCAGVVILVLVYVSFSLKASLSLLGEVPLSSWQGRALFIGQRMGFDHACYGPDKSGQFTAQGGGGDL